MEKKLIIVDIVSKGEKNTRYLVTDGSEFHSFLGKSGVFNIGDYITKNEIQLLDAKERWISSYESKNNYPRKAMIEHLINYKENKLHNNNKGHYKNNLYAHIFKTPEDNLILGKGFDSELLQQISKLREKGVLRSDFNHLTSSQAFAINFFTPLVIERKLSLLHECFTNTDYNKCEYENVIDTKELTQFDFFAYGRNGYPSCSIEVKYSENEFGATFADPRHIDKYRSVYDKQMKELTSIDESQYSFFEYYQIWRNLLYAVERNQHICFLFPAFRKDLKLAVEHITEKCKDRYKPLFHTLIADIIVDKIITSEDKLRPYYEEFREKYLAIKI
ncbi:MAG: hypothetical protein J6T04_01530 [Bacteroidales bacterium]|nr:hypothetical protein [Bacteroidales bacterium]